MPTMPMPPMATLTKLASLSMRGTGVTALPLDFCQLPRAVALARRQEAVVAVTGEVDLVTDGPGQQQPAL